MDKIYSRNRIKLPKCKVFFFNKNEKASKLIKIMMVLIIAISTFSIIFKSIEPIFEQLCIAKAQELATNITNKETSNILNSIDYANIAKLIENENTKTSFIQSDVVKMNKIASDVAIAIQGKLSEIKDNDVYIPLGSLTGNKYFSGIGPEIPIKVMLVGNVITDFKTEFVSTGINQTSHRIYLEICCNINILTPYKTINNDITNQILLVETVIVGEIPNTYYDIEGIKDESALDLIE